MERLTTLFIDFNIIGLETVSTILRSFSFNTLNSTMSTLNSILNFISTRITSSTYSNRFSKKIKIERENNDILIRVTTRS